MRKTAKFNPISTEKKIQKGNKTCLSDHEINPSNFKKIPNETTVINNLQSIERKSSKAKHSLCDLYTKYRKSLNKVCKIRKSIEKLNKNPFVNKYSKSKVLNEIIRLFSIILIFARILIKLKISLLALRKLSKSIRKSSEIEYINR